MWRHTPDLNDVYEELGYSLVQVLGTGVFADVHKCISLETKQVVALKFPRRSYGQYGKREVAVCEKLRALDPDKCNLIKLNKYFEVSGMFIMEFDILDMTLDDLMERSDRPPHLCEIQVITQQILVALNALKSINVVHTDIKPDNIMLVNHHQLPFKVKLIDFGLACTVSKMRLGDKMQTCVYRAPEVILGLPLNEALDMWAFGCVVAFLYLGEDLYSSKCEHERMRHTVQLHGQPNNNLLNSGLYTTEFFTRDEDSPILSWTMNTRCSSTGNLERHTLSSLEDIVKTRTDTAANENMQAFVSLLKQMMEVDQHKRITPGKALGHPFLAMEVPCDSASNARFSSSCLSKQNCQLEELSVKAKQHGMVMNVETANSSLEYFVSYCEETAACTNDNAPLAAYFHGAKTTRANDGSPAAADKITIANNTRTLGKAHLKDTHTGTSPASACHGFDRDNACIKEKSAIFPEVKTKKKGFKRIHRFLFHRVSMLFKSCSTADVD